MTLPALTVLVALCSGLVAAGTLLLVVRLVGAS